MKNRSKANNPTEVSGERAFSPDYSYLSFALVETPDIGNVRETFVLNQLLNAGVSVSSPSEGDFLADGLTIEVGGKSKSENQVKHLDPKERLAATWHNWQWFNKYIWNENIELPIGEKAKEPIAD